MVQPNIVKKRKGDVKAAEWGKITGFLEIGKSISEISRIVGRSRNTVRSVSRLPEPPAPRRMRAVSMKVQRRRKLVEKLLQKTKTVNDRELPAFPSAAAVMSGLRRLHRIRVSRATVANDLHLVADNFVRPATPFEGRASLEAREAFKRYCSGLDIRKVVFSDEHWLTTNDHTCKTMWAVKGLTRRERRRLLVPRVRKARYNIPSFMIWAAIGVGYKSKLVFIPRPKDEEGKVKSLNSQRYIRTCLSTMTNGQRQLPEDAIFMQDGARCHTAKATLAYLERKGISLLLNWPAYSPDLNPIENLWAYLDYLIAQKGPKSAADLRRIAESVWETLPQDIIDNFVLSFAGKLENI